MAGSSKTTTDRKVIQKWIEDRGGQPVTVRRTGDEEDPGVLRIDFEANGKEDSLEPITWDAFFEKFEEKNLAFLYQEQKADGQESRFFKFVKRDGGDDDDGGGKNGGKNGAKDKKK
jgi:hypothetical protein